MPSTLAADGDPLDVVIFADSPGDVGCTINVRVIGVIEGREASRAAAMVQNDRIVAVATSSDRYGDYKSLRDMPTRVVNQTAEFFVAYNKARGKKFKVSGIRGPGRAAALIAQAVRAFQEQGEAE